MTGSPPEPSFGMRLPCRRWPGAASSLPHALHRAAAPPDPRGDRPVRAPRAARAYAVAAGELFAPFGPHAGHPAVDHGPFDVGAGRRVSPTLRVEMGYLNRATVDDGRARTRDHALRVAIASSGPFAAGRRPAP